MIPNGTASEYYGGIFAGIDVSYPIDYVFGFGRLKVSMFLFFIFFFFHFFFWNFYLFFVIFEKAKDCRKDWLRIVCVESKKNKKIKKNWWF